MGMKDYQLLEEKLSILLHLGNDEVDTKDDISNLESRLETITSNLADLKKEHGSITRKHSLESLDQDIKNASREIEDNRSHQISIEDRKKEIELEIESSIFKRSVVSVVFTLLVAAYFGFLGIQLQSDMWDAPFTCDSGEEITSAQLFDDVVDCSGGDDEDEGGIISTSRAYDFSERTGAFEVFFVTGCSMIPWLVLAFFAGNIRNLQLSEFTKDWIAPILGRGSKTMPVYACVALISLGMLGVSMPDTEATWTCDDEEQEILYLHVSDGYSHCSDGSDESTSGFFDDYTRAEDAEDELSFDAILVSWIIAVVVALLCIASIFVLSRIGVDKADALSLEKRGRIAASTQTDRKMKILLERKQSRKKTLARLSILPDLIDDAVKEIDNLNHLIQEKNRELLSIKDRIEKESERIKHLVPYL